MNIQDSLELWDFSSRGFWDLGCSSRNPETPKGIGNKKREKGKIPPSLRKNGISSILVLLFPLPGIFSQCLSQVFQYFPRIFFSRELGSLQAAPPRQEEEEDEEIFQESRTIPGPPGDSSGLDPLGFRCLQGFHPFPGSSPLFPSLPNPTQDPPGQFPFSCRNPELSFPQPHPSGNWVRKQEKDIGGPEQNPSFPNFSPPGNPGSTPAFQSWDIQVLPPAKPSFPGVPGSSGWIWDEWIRPRTGVNPSLPTPGEAPEPVRPLPGIWATLGFGISGDTQELWDAAPSAQREGLEFRGDQSMDFFLSSLSHKVPPPSSALGTFPGPGKGWKMGFLGGKWDFWNFGAINPWIHPRFWSAQGAPTARWNFGGE